MMDKELFVFRSFDNFLYSSAVIYGPKLKTKVRIPEEIIQYSNCQQMEGSWTHTHNHQQLQKTILEKIGVITALIE